MGAVSAGVSVVGGIVGLGQQQRSANAQRRAIRSQQEAAALQSELQLMSLKQQTYADSLNDYIADSTRELQYQQAQTQLQSQQIQNDLAVANAKFDASVQRANANIQQMSADRQAQAQKSQADLAAGNATTEVMGQELSKEQQAIGSFLKLLGEGDQQQTAIANILDMASASGGVNEALSLLLGEDQATIANAGLARQQQSSESTNALARSVENANVQLNQADYNVSTGINALQREQGIYQADVNEQNADYSKKVVDAGFESKRASNEATYRTGIISDQANRYSRDYLRKENESALLRGAQLQQETLKAQADSVRSPGFFDYLNVGVQGYNTYRQMS